MNHGPFRLSGMWYMVRGPCAGMHQFASFFRINSMSYNANNLPPGLFDKVMLAIALERARLKAIRNFIISSFCGLGALISAVFVWNGLVRELVTSGFGQYASLIFVDFKAVVANWQDYGMSLLESFPAVNAAELIGEVIIVMILIKLAIAYAKKIPAVRHLKTVSGI